MDIQLQSMVSGQSYDKNSCQYNTFTDRSYIRNLSNTITANGKKQWLDRFGIIKANSTEIDENVTIPSGTNGLSVGTIRVGAGYSLQFKVIGG